MRNFLAFVIFFMVSCKLVFCSPFIDTHHLPDPEEHGPNCPKGKHTHSKVSSNTIPGDENPVPLDAGFIMIEEKAASPGKDSEEKIEPTMDTKTEVVRSMGKSKIESKSPLVEQILPIETNIEEKFNITEPTYSEKEVQLNADSKVVTVDSTSSINETESKIESTTSSEEKISSSTEPTSSGNESISNSTVTSTRASESPRNESDLRSANPSVETVQVPVNSSTKLVSAQTDENTQEEHKSKEVKPAVSTIALLAHFAFGDYLSQNTSSLNKTQQGNQLKLNQTQIDLVHTFNKIHANCSQCQLEMEKSEGKNFTHIGCTCAIFGTQTPKATDVPLMSKTFGNISCHHNVSGEDACSQICIALALNYYKVRDQMICSHNRDAFNYTAYMQTKVCQEGSEWFYTGLSTPKPVCCLLGKVVNCTTA